MRTGAVAVEFLQSAQPIRSAERERVSERSRALSATESKDERFARDQIRGLVRRVFSSGVTPQIRQVVFCAAEPETDIGGVCWRVGTALAMETAKELVVVTIDPQQAVSIEEEQCVCVRDLATRLTGNLWSLSIPDNGGTMSAESFHRFLGQIRREFEYSIVAASGIGASQAATLAQFADGIIVVLSALRTRRAAARRLLEELSQVRVLGTVLTDREFPIPDGVYRRL